MAKARTLKSDEEFTCPVCLELLKDPMTTPCDHNFCNVCINRCWCEENRGSYSCPECRKTSTSRPVLRRNNMLAEVVEKLMKKTELQAASPAHCSTGPGDVECDSCIGRKHKAIKFSLVCQASYCEDHLTPHFQSPAFKKHKLVEACAELQEKICSQHDKPICYLYMTDEHKGHDTVAAEAERSKKRNELKEEQMKSQQKIQEKQQKLQELKKALVTIKKHLQAAVDDSERPFIEINLHSEVKELITDQEKAELSRAEQLLKQLEQEIATLKSRVTELEQLSHTHNIHFLQSLPSLCVYPECEDSSSITIYQNISFDRVRKFPSNLKKQVEEICEEKFNKICPQATSVWIHLSLEPKRKEDFLKYFFYLTLDPNTVHHQLILSERNRAVKYCERKQRYSDHPERFGSWSQVLCKERVCGRCYWEVEWSTVGFVDISVSYIGIRRKGLGFKSGFGYNSQSWSLECSHRSVFFRHNDTETKIRGPVSSRIGVYVDHSAGTLSFYSVSDTMRLLHSVHTTFTQPLYAGFILCNAGSTVRLCNLK